MHGERITQDIVDYIKILKEQKTQLQGTADPYIDHIMVLGVIDGLQSLFTPI